MKRILIIVFALVICLVLSGCFNAKIDGKNTNQYPSGTPESGEADEGIGELYIDGSAESTPEELISHIFQNIFFTYPESAEISEADNSLTVLLKSGERTVSFVITNSGTLDITNEALVSNQDYFDELFQGYSGSLSGPSLLSSGTENISGKDAIKIQFTGKSAEIPMYFEAIAFMHNGIHFKALVSVNEENQDLIAELAAPVINSFQFLERPEDLSPPLSPSLSPEEQVSQIEEIKSSTDEQTYEEISENPEAHIDQSLHFRGEVTQVMESDNVCAYKVNVSQEGGSWTDAIYVECLSKENLPAISEGNIIDVYGVMIGMKKYQSVRDGSYSIPYINATHIELVQ